MRPSPAGQSKCDGIWVSFGNPKRQATAEDVKRFIGSIGRHVDGKIQAPNFLSALGGGNVCIKPGSGASFKDCDDCPEMVVVPAGSFMMGSKGGDSDETPVRTWRPLMAG